jgi:hypothetical protein
MYIYKKIFPQLDHLTNTCPAFNRHKYLNKKYSHISNTDDNILLMLISLTSFEVFTVII